MNYLTPLSILEFAIGLTLLIIIHELGHYLVSRRMGIEVEEFGIGFPPRIGRLFKIGKTDFTLNWILLGGFVRPKGENDPTVEGGLAAANPWKRLGVYFAGPVMNIVLGVILFTLVFAQLGSIPDLFKVKLAFVEDGSPAAQAGLKEGDLILAADGKKIRLQNQLADIIRENRGQELTLVYERDGKETETTAIPRENPAPNQGALGIVMTSPEEPFTWGKGLTAGFNQVQYYLSELSYIIQRLISGQSNSQEAGVMGLVGMGKFYVDMRKDEVSNGISPWIQILAFFGTISLSLGLMNLLPIPAVDGGRILLTLPEIIFENWVNGVSFILLLILLIYINIRDIFNVFNK
jgi:regulator of sigma E protease